MRSTIILLHSLAVLGTDVRNICYNLQPLKIYWLSRLFPPLCTFSKGLSLSTSFTVSIAVWNFIENILNFQEQLLLDPMFEVPGSDIKTVHITSSCVKGENPPIYIRKEENATSTDNDDSEDRETTKVRATQ